MKLGWVFIIIGGGYLLFRLCYAVAWGFWSTSLTSWSDALGIIGYAMVFGGIPLLIGISRVLKKRKTKSNSIATIPLKSTRMANKG